MSGPRVRLLPAETALVNLRTLSEVRGLVGVPDGLWNAFLDVTGDPGESISLFAQLPVTTLTEALSRTTLPGGFTPAAMQATQVGLLWRTCRLWVHFEAGGTYDDFVDVEPWSENHGRAAVPDSSSGSRPSGVKEKVLKMASLLDQSDESELLPPENSAVRSWNERYVLLMGAPPQEEEEATDFQLAALFRRVYELDQAPYTDFGVWLPFGRRSLKASKYRSFYPLGDGSFVVKELPGPTNFQNWLLCWRVFKTAALSIGCVSLAALQLYERNFEKLVTQWPKAWGLLVQADDKARGERLEKTRRSLVFDEKKGKSMPDDWKSTEPWTACFRLVATDESFWNEQVRHPATSWTASGGHGAPIAPAEAIAQAHLPGGSDAVEVPKEQVDDRRRQGNKDRRAAKKKRWQADRDELSKFRAERSSSGVNKTVDKGRPKSKDAQGNEICFSWAKNSGTCANAAPGSECKAKVKRMHRCQICLSPGHQNHSCPQKPQG